MKILSVVAGVLIDDAMSRRILNINKLLVSLGHEVHLVQYVRESVWKSCRGNSVDLSGFDHSIVFSSRVLTNLSHLRELCRDNYDLTYGNTYGGTFWSILGKLTSVPLLYDMHGSIVEESRLNLGSNIGIQEMLSLFAKTSIEQSAIVCSDRVACVSRKMMSYVKAQKTILPKKIFYVTNGIDLNFFKQADDSDVQVLKRQLGIEDKLVFGYIGDLQKWQGVENFIDATRRIDDKEMVFVVVGVKQKQIQKLGNLLLIPRVKYSQIPLYSCVCDVLVLPRPSHPATEIAAPTKFAEYAAMNKPILTTSVGDAADLVKQYNCGIVIKNNSIPNLLGGIEQFRQKSLDICKEMGNNSRKLAETEFDWNKIKLNLREAINV